jgi:spermidine/putrescine transport system ATP-binding protein
MKTEIMVELKHVEKFFGENRVAKDVSFCVYQGEFLTILGSSGSGKTTTLRMIAGFENPDSGTILVEGKKVEEKEPYDREVNTVFQNYALFPHMNVFDNIAFGLKMKHIPKLEIRERVQAMLDLIQLSEYGLRKPDQLSGGQRQRVAIARAVVNRPKVLLLDEPLGALDLKLRKQMQFELKRMQKKLGITFIYVTHDQEEALSMSDRIAIMNNGCLEQLGTPQEIYEQPASKFVADFIGESNLFSGKVLAYDASCVSVSIDQGMIVGKGKAMPEDEVYLSIRPEKIKISEQAKSKFYLKGTIKETIYMGAMLRTLILLDGGQEIKMNTFSGIDIPEIDTAVYVYWDVQDAYVICEKTGDFLPIMQQSRVVHSNDVCSMRQVV